MRYLVALGIVGFAAFGTYAPIWRPFCALGIGTLTVIRFVHAGTTNVQKPR